MESSFTEKIKKNIPLGPLTTFKIGGPAEFFFEACSEEDMVNAARFAKDNKLKIHILGGASNVLINDEGIKGLVIKITGQADNLSIKEVKGCYSLKCWAGASLASVLRQAADNGLTGLEWAAGIPGSIGGAIRGNAGAFGGCVADSVSAVQILDIQTLEVKSFQKEQCKFGYRQSLFKRDENLIIFSAEIKLEKGEKKAIDEKMKEILLKRAGKQPKGLASPGSFFENPIVDDPELIARFEKDFGAKCLNDKIPAGWLISEAGLKGKRIGDIQISDEHANFIVNLGKGTSNEVIMMASFIKQQVRDQFGVQLKEEVKYLGFE